MMDVSPPLEGAPLEGPPLEGGGNQRIFWVILPGTYANFPLLFIVSDQFGGQRAKIFQRKVGVPFQWQEP